MLKENKYLSALCMVLVDCFHINYEKLEESHVKHMTAIMNSDGEVTIIVPAEIGSYLEPHAFYMYNCTDLSVLVYSDRYMEPSGITKEELFNYVNSQK